MCIDLSYRPLWLPELSSLARFKVVEKRNGFHVARNSFRYPIRALRLDPNAVTGSHDRCMHFAFDPDDARANLLGEYGSHILFCALIPYHYWSKINGRRGCLHGDATVPLGCLTCGEGGFEPEIIQSQKGIQILPRNASMTDPLGWVRQLPVVES